MDLLNHPDLRDAGEFIFIGSDGVDGRYGRNFASSITLDFPYKEQQYFSKYINKMTPMNSFDNPWYLQTWKKHFNCEFSNSSKSNKEQCSSYLNETLPERDPLLKVGTVIDCVNTVVNSLHTLISELCPFAFINPSLLRRCVHGDDLLKYIKNASFEGTGWKISFNPLGDMIGGYQFNQHPIASNAPLVAIGDWNKLTGMVRINASLTDWSSFVPHAADTLATLNSSSVPESLCSSSCGPRMYKQHRELMCCWDCIPCRDNEIINTQHNGCEQCPELYWPDDTNGTHCHGITPR